MNKPKKPEFKQQNSHRIKRLNSDRWRRPKGLHSKIRLHKAGNPKEPSQGYRAPKAIRFMDPTGVHTVVVSSLKQLDDIKDAAIIVASNVGAKKKLAIIQAATAKKLTVLNIASDYAKKIETQLADRKKSRDALKKKRTLLVEPKEKKTSKAKPKKEAATDAKEKKEEAQKEAEKVITKRG